MIMEPYDVYKSYLALKLHFTTDQYDVIKQRGRVRATKEAFFKRTDLFSIKKIANDYSDKEVVDFLVANFVSGDRWGGIFDSDSKTTYFSWKKRIESITYTFEKDLGKIALEAEKIGATNYSFLVSLNNQLPKIVNLYLRHDISIETLVILNKLNNYTDELDRLLSDNIIWPDVSRLIKKYSPFLNINKQKYYDILRTRLGHN